jgi:ligand-binding SRPBCC domain-containing protein
MGPVGKGFRLNTAMWLPRPVNEVFAFFANAGNLNSLTPEWIRFRIVTPLPIIMKCGVLIDYRLRLRGVPIAWQSEITAWEPPFRFVDEQRRGPYRRWIHEHRFLERNGGTEVIDNVDYAVTGGRLVHKLLVARDLQAIFEFRQCKLIEIFADGESDSP